MPRRSILAALFLAVVFLGPVLVRAQAQPAGEVKSRLERANALYRAGSDQEAKAIYESLLPQLRAQGPSRELAEALRNLYDIVGSAGNYDRALALANEAASICRSLHDSSCEANARNDAGLAYSNAGDYGRAGAELEAALKLSSASDGKTAVLILNNLGNVYYYQAKYSEALRTYEAALPYVEKSSGEPWALAWRRITRLNLATLYSRLGNDRRAIAIYHEVSDDPAGLSQREIAHILANLGVVYRHLGDGEEAIKNYHDAEKYYSKQQDVDGELGVLKNIGIVQALELGRLKDALKTFDRALALAEKSKSQRESMQVRLYRGETLYRMAQLAQAEREFEAALASATQLGTVEEQWKALYALGRIALRNRNADQAEAKFREAITRIESLRSKLQLSRLRSDFLADKRDVYDALIKLLLLKNDVAGAFEFIERSRSRVFQDRFEKVAPGLITLAHIQERLQPDSALIELWTGPDSVAAVWVTRQGSGIARKDFSVEEMTQFQQIVSGLPENLGQDWRSSFARISALVPAGIAPLTQNEYAHLLIVPDGFLSLAPFELMEVEKGELLLEKHDVTYLPSAVLLLRGVQERGRTVGLPWQRQLVAFGDPSVVGTGESTLLAERDANGAAGNLAALPSSGEEIRAIAGMSSGRVQLFLGPADRKPDFFAAALAGASLLHVSTHAIADVDNPERSRLLFSPDEPGQANNFVFLKELYDLDLRGVSLATLSACDTERGRVVPGEGIQAFSRALLAAGSRSTLTTLWRVPDQPTSQFMQQFYYYLVKKRKSKAEALGLTKLEFLRSGTELSHPRYWAAFVLNGDGAAPAPRFLSWQLLATPLLALAAAALVLIQLWSRKQAATRARKPVSLEA
ncbi:MAG TPA: CHAT domain-containing protein [Candidatus Angelobacter sp.]